MTCFLFASPLEGEVGPQDREGGIGPAFSLPPAMRRHTPLPSVLRTADLPLATRGRYCFAQQPPLAAGGGVESTLVGSSRV